MASNVKGRIKYRYLMVGWLRSDWLMYLMTSTAGSRTMIQVSWNTWFLEITSRDYINPNKRGIPASTKRGAVVCFPPTTGPRTVVGGKHKTAPLLVLFLYKTVLPPPPCHRAGPAPTAGCMFSSNAPSLVLHATTS